MAEECKRFRQQYEGQSYPAVWAAKWGGNPPIKQEKPANHAIAELEHTPTPPLTQSPAGGTESPYPGGFFAGGGGALTSETLYETMSQNYPALTSSLGIDFTSYFQLLQEKGGGGNKYDPFYKF